jgi:hypothetical protein
VQHAPQFRDAPRPAARLQQPEHLGVAVLLDDVDPLVAVDERLDLGGERIRPQAQVRRRQPGLALELVARLSPVAQCEVP